MSKSMVMKGALALLMVMLVVAAAVANTPATGADEVTALNLDGSKWELLEMNGTAVIEGSQITAEFAEGRIAGTAGVNNYFSDYTLDGDVFSLGMVGSTMMAGPQELMDQETAFLAALQSASAASMDGDSLEITTAAGSLRFAPVH